MKSLISVIMPVYNAESCLNIAIESILKQSFKQYELLLINDGSTDSSGLLCDEYAIKNINIRVVHQKNLGISAARNVGIRLAKSDYIAFCDDDDEYEIDFLKTAYEYAEKYEADIVKFGNKTIIKEDNIVKKIVKCMPINNHIYYKKDMAHLIGKDYAEFKWYVWDGIYKRDIILNSNLYFNEGIIGGWEDVDFIYRMIPKLNSFILISRVMYKHYIQDNYNTSYKYNENRYKSLEYLYKSKKEAAIELNIIKKLPYYNCYLLGWLIRKYICNMGAVDCNYKIEKVKQKLEKLYKNHSKEINFSFTYYFKTIGISYYSAICVWLLAHKCFIILTLMTMMQRVKNRII